MPNRGWLEGFFAVDLVARHVVARHVVALHVVALAGCGATISASAPTSSAVVTIDPPAFLQEVGATSTVVLRQPEASVDELDTARRELRGAERRVGMRDLAIALMFAAEGAEGREQRRLLRQMNRMADSARRGNRDPQLNAELDFVKLWSSWRSGSRGAGRLAERFTVRHRQTAAELVALAWMIRGEVAFVGDDFDDAIESYRFALGRLDSPLYAFALLRTAHAQRRLGNGEQAQQALSEVERLGCEAETAEPIRRVALAAASEAGTGSRDDVDGVTRPASCPEPTDDDDAEGEDEGWRPAE